MQEQQRAGSPTRDGIVLARKSLSPSQNKKDHGSSGLSPKSKSKYVLMSVPLDDDEKQHAPTDPKGAIAFVGISVGSVDFEDQEFWELCRSIVEAGYDEIVFVVGGVLQRHNVYISHAQKKAIKNEEVTKDMMEAYEKEKSAKKKGKAFDAENSWLERHQQYMDKLKEYGKKVTVILWNDILQEKYGKFNEHLAVIDNEYANGRNGIKTYVSKAASDMHDLRSKQTSSMTSRQKEIFDTVCVDQEVYFKGKNAEYFKEETAAFRMLAAETFAKRKLHYIYPPKMHQIGIYFLKAIRRALELVSDAQKKLMEFYGPLPRNRAKKEDTTQRLHGEMEILRKTNEALVEKLQVLTGELEGLRFQLESVVPLKVEAIIALQEQMQAKQYRLARVSALVGELKTGLEKMQSLPAHLRAEIVKSYTDQLAQVAEEEEQEVKAAPSISTPRGENLSGTLSRISGSASASGSGSEEGTPRNPEEDRSNPIQRKVSKTGGSLVPAVTAPQSSFIKPAPADHQQRQPSSPPVAASAVQQKGPKIK